MERRRRAGVAALRLLRRTIGGGARLRRGAGRSARVTALRLRRSEGRSARFLIQIRLDSFGATQAMMQVGVMEREAILVVGICVGSVVLFVTERLRVDLVALLVLLALAATGLVSPIQAVGGFSSPAVLAICAIYVLSSGLYRAGVASLLGRQIMRVAARGETALLCGLMGVAAVLSFFMNTVGIVALLMPVVMDIARRMGLAPSRLLMPLSYASLLGGLTTLFATTSNLLVSQALQNAGLRPFGMLDFLPTGGLAALAGLGFILVVGRRWLPHRDIEATARGGLLQKSLDFGERMLVLHLPAGSVLAGKTLEDSCLGSALGLHVLGVVRRGKTLLGPAADFVLRGGDQLLVQGTKAQLEALEGWRRLVVQDNQPGVEALLAAGLDFSEARVAEGSPYVGRTIAMVGIRREFGLTVLAVRRGALVRRGGLQRWQIQAGDTLLLHGKREKLDNLTSASALTDIRQTSAEELHRNYRLDERLFHLRVQPESHLVGETLAKSRLGHALGFAVLAILREGQSISLPAPEETIMANDQLLVAGRAEDLSVLAGVKDLRIEQRPGLNLRELESEDSGLVEAVLSPQSTLAGKTLREIHFREKFGLMVLALWREGEAHATQLGDMTLRFGDAILLFGSREKLKLLAENPEFVLLTEAVREAPRYDKVPWALGSMAVFLILALGGWMPLHLAAILGAVIMVLSGCLPIEAACRSIDLKAVILIAGMLPLGIAMESTGTARLLAENLVAIVKPFGSVAVLAGVFIVTSIGASLMPAAAVVLLMAPIVLGTANELGISPHALMMAMAMAAAGSFNSPVGHPANVMIMGPGGYRFVDYLKVGVPLSLVVMIVVVVFLSLVSS